MALTLGCINFPCHQQKSISNQNFPNLLLWFTLLLYLIFSPNLLFFFLVYYVNYARENISLYKILFWLGRRNPTHLHIQGSKLLFILIKLYCWNWKFYVSLILIKRKISKIIECCFFFLYNAGMVLLLVFSCVDLGLMC